MSMLDEIRNRLMVDVKELKTRVAELEAELRHYRRIYGTDRVLLEYEFGVQDMVKLKERP